VFTGLKDLVGNRNGDLHGAMVSPRYDPLNLTHKPPRISDRADAPNVELNYP
jgi:hypothetical protein